MYGPNYGSILQIFNESTFPFAAIFPPYQSNDDQEIILSLAIILCIYTNANLDTILASRVHITYCPGYLSLKQQLERSSFLLVHIVLNLIWKKHLFLFAGSRMISREEFCATNKIGLVVYEPV